MTQDYESTARLPENTVAVGEPGHDGVRVYIRQDTYRELEELCLSDTTREKGSVLLGDYSERDGVTSVVVSEFVEARHADPSMKTLTFTNETWEHVHQQHRLMYDGLRMVGWQHSHPGGGVFLSDYGAFVQDSFFNQSYQVAYVIDPVRKTRGFFGWKNGKLIKLKGFYIYDEPGKSIRIRRLKRPPLKVAVEEEGAPSGALRLVAAVIALASIAMAMFAVVFTGATSARLSGQQQEIDTLLSQAAEQQRRLDSQQQELDSRAAALGELREALAGSLMAAGDLDAVTALAERIEQDGADFEGREELLAELRAYIADYEDPLEGMVYFKAYTAQRGENLTTICADHGIDYAKNAAVIRAINGLGNPDRILTGQQVLLPVPVR